MKKWKRVQGPNLCPRLAEEKKRTDTILNDPIFKKACKAVGIEPSRRQARKFYKKKGVAYVGV